MLSNIAFRNKTIMLVSIISVLWLRNQKNMYTMAMASCVVRVESRARWIAKSICKIGESLEKHRFDFRHIRPRCTINNRRFVGLIWRLCELTWVVSWEENSLQQRRELTGQFHIHDKSFVNGDGVAVEHRGKRKRTPRSTFPPVSVSTLVYRGVVTSVVCERCLLYRLQLRRGVQP